MIEFEQDEALDALRQLVQADGRAVFDADAALKSFCPAVVRRFNRNTGNGHGVTVADETRFYFNMAGLREPIFLDGRLVFSGVVPSVVERYPRDNDVLIVDLCYLTRGPAAACWCLYMQLARRVRQLERLCHEHNRKRGLGT